MNIAFPNIRDGQWRTWFAWHPVEVAERLIWLERVERRWDAEANCVGDFSGYAYPLGGWEYRVISKGGEP